MRRICVFCGSSPGGDPAYLDAARQVGQALVCNGLELVYGGGRVGLMGEVARTVMAGGGHVIGVIPKFLADKEVAFTGIADLQIVDSMHERKARMADLADAFIALPGGLGTLEEFFEVLTWAQLGIHHKPCGFLNVCRYYDPILTFLDQAVARQFVAAAHRNSVLAADTPDDLLRQFAAYQPPVADKAAWALQLNQG
jgi:uncharacterized protein (TIGR00730 family)